MRLNWIFAILLVGESTRKGSKRRASVQLAPPSRSREFPREILPGYTILGLSENGRFLEQFEFPDSFLPYQYELYEGISIIMKREENFDSFTPRNFTSLTELTPFGKFSLGKQIAASTQSALFTLHEIPDYLIKYQMNCIELREAEMGALTSNVSFPIHPLMLDYMFLRLAYHTGVVPVANFLSPPGIPCPRKSGKCHFDMSETQFDFCRENHSSLRYLLLERVPGTDLHQFKTKFPSGAVPVPIALIIGIALIDALERIHVSARVVHGDIHLGNVIVGEVDAESETAKISLIDFGRGSLNGRRPPDPIKQTYHWNNELYSRWELEGYAIAARDDLDRAIDVIGRLMNSWRYFDYEDEVKKAGPVALRIHKKESEVFWLPGLKNPIDTLEIDEGIKCLIKHELKRVVSLVKNLSDINEIPPYEAIRAGFKTCLQLIQIDPTSFDIECVPI